MTLLQQARQFRGTYEARNNFGDDIPQMMAESAAKVRDEAMQAAISHDNGDKQRVLLLASYCSECSDLRPCDDCLAICNVAETHIDPEEVIGGLGYLTAGYRPDHGGDGGGK